MWINSSSDSARLHLVKIFVKPRLQKQHTSYLLHFGQVLQVSEMCEENKLITIKLRALGHLLALKRLLSTRNQFRNTFFFPSPHFSNALNTWVSSPTHGGTVRDLQTYPCSKVILFFISNRKVKQCKN